MKLFKKMVYFFERKIHKNEPWLEYYSREDRKIKFTKKSIYEFMREGVGDDLSYFALNYFENRITYDDLLKHIEVCAKALREFGVKKGDIITICMPNMPEAIYIFYACNKIGAVADIIHPLSSPEQIKFYLNESKSSYLFLVDFNYEKVSDIIDKTVVHKVILASPSISMPRMLSIGYRITRAPKTMRPDKDDDKYISWRSFYNVGLFSNAYLNIKVKSDDFLLYMISTSIGMTYMTS